MKNKIKEEEEGFKMWVKGSTKCGQAGESIPAHLHKAILSLQ